jgi:hypothetical protein
VWFGDVLQFGEGHRRVRDVQEEGRGLWRGVQEGLFGPARRSGCVSCLGFWPCLLDSVLPHRTQQKRRLV